MPVSLKNTNYGDSHAARRHHAVEAPPAPVGKHKPEPVPAASSATKVASVVNAKKADQETARREAAKETSPTKARTAADELTVFGANGDVEYDDSEETDDTDSIEAKPRKKKRK